MKDMTYVIQQTLIDASTYDAYYYARRILSFHINFNFGFSLDDLPDTSELADISDTICDIIKEHRSGDINENNAIYDIKMLLDDIDIDFIELQVY
jgi:hypothetical protein